MARTLERATYSIRRADFDDIPAIQTLLDRVYKAMPNYSAAMLRGQISTFADGQFVVVHNGTVVGYSASFIISEVRALEDHTWREITGGGYASLHDPGGDVLYGMEVAVDPGFRSLRLGRRLYDARKRLCEKLRLKGIVFVGRIPGLAKFARTGGTPEEYVRKVQAGELRDQVLSFQIRNGFVIERLIPTYLRSDMESLGYGALLYWRNPRYVNVSQVEGSTALRAKRRVRVGIVQYQLRKISSFEEFGQNVEYFVDALSEYGTDFILFPELFTLQILSTFNSEMSSKEALPKLFDFAAPFDALMKGLAVRYNVNIIGGTHLLRRPSGEVRNVCHVFLRDGSVHEQAKIHPTPSESDWWDIQGGSQLSTILTDCGPIGILICYDSEFPELARHLTDQGAQILFIPFCTDTREAFNRVRYCAHARAIENQVYTVLAGNVGNLPSVENMDIQYAQSCVLEPCDFGFARDGIAVDTTPNTEMVAIADLRLDDLQMARNAGTVRQLKDRRHDLYSVVWQELPGQ